MAVSKYVEQYDLAIYPDQKPKQGRRVICGIEKGSTFDKSFKGYALWHGGGGIGRATTLRVAREALHSYIVRKLRQRVAGAKAEAEYYQAQLDCLEGDVRKLVRFEVVPEDA